MQEQKSKADEETRGGRYLNPARAFTAACLLLVLVASLWFVSGNSQSRTGPASDKRESSGLSRDDPIQIFNRLNRQRHAAYRYRDITLIEQVFAPETAISRIAHSEISKLERDEVFDTSTYDTRSVSVLRLSATKVVLEEEVVVQPRFKTESGLDVTDNAGPLRQLTRWTLTRVNDEWLISDGVLVESEKL